MSSFTELANARRSAMKFIPEVKIGNEEIEDILHVVKSAPSAFNLQHTRYLVVREPELIGGIYEAANKQYKVKSASAVVIVLGDMDAYQEIGNINEGLLNLGVMNKQEYDMTVNSVLSFYESGGEALRRDEAIRSASLSAMLFMLSAKDKGWDTCPMIG
ncbi:nitroreductase family protein, partial [Paenibacillus sepulcri]|nr:nitroreductase family protein [Paenibacillus sepulcri]